MKKAAHHLIAEVPRRHSNVEMTIGIDLGEVGSHYCTLNKEGEVVDRGRFRTTPKGLEKWFTGVPPARVAMEAKTHSVWISEQLQELGHHVIVANVRELRSISHGDRKSDHADAEKLARFARLDSKILRPIAHRTVEQQEALTLIRARDLMVRLRTAAVNAVRGLTKPCGYRLPASSTRCFVKRSLAVMPPTLVQALGPVLQPISAMTIKIKQCDLQIKKLTETEYPETQALLKVHGVGQITALTYVLTLGSRCFGLRAIRAHFYRLSWRHVNHGSRHQQSWRDCRFVPYYSASSCLVDQGWAIHSACPDHCLGHALQSSVQVKRSRRRGRAIHWRRWVHTRISAQQKGRRDHAGFPRRQRHQRIRDQRIGHGRWPVGPA